MSEVISAITAILLVMTGAGIVSASGDGGANAGAGGAGKVQFRVPSRYAIYSHYPSPSYRPGTSVFYSPVNGADYRYRRTCPYKHWHFLQDDIILGVFRDFGR